MSTSKIEQDLQAVSNVKSPRKNDDRQKYLTKLMLAVAKIPDADWEGLTVEAQEWVNGGAEAHKAGDALADFPDYVEVDDNPRPEEVDEEEAPPPAKAKKEEKKPEAKPVKEAATPTNGTGRKVSACHTIKKMVVKKPTISVAELSEKLKANGLKVSDVTIATLRSDLRDTLRVMNELNLGTFVL